MNTFAEEMTNAMASEEFNSAIDMALQPESLAVMCHMYSNVFEKFAQMCEQSVRDKARIAELEAKLAQLGVAA